MAANCTVEANGTTLTCACPGCGIAYNHDTKTYHILCCGSITEMKAANQTDNPTDPPKPGHIIVNFSGVTMLQAAQLLDRAAPGKVRIQGSVGELETRVSLKANQPLSELIKKLGLHSTAK